MNVTAQQNCKRCIHFSAVKAKRGWYCHLNRLADMVEKGYLSDADALPDPEEFVCDDFEPP
jgi:hypothetical protein